MANQKRCVRAGIWTSSIQSDFSAAHETLAVHDNVAVAKNHLSGAAFHAASALKELPIYKVELSKLKVGANRLRKRLGNGQPLKKVVDEVLRGIRALSQRARQLVYRAEKDCGFKRPSQPTPL